MQDRAILSLTRISTQPKNGCLTRSEVGGLEKKTDQHLCRLLRHAANSSVKHRDSTNRNAREIASRMRKSRGSRNSWKGIDSVKNKFSATTRSGFSRASFDATSVKTPTLALLERLNSSKNSSCSKCWSWFCFATFAEAFLSGRPSPRPDTGVYSYIPR